MAAMRGGGWLCWSSGQPTTACRATRRATRNGKRQRAQRAQRRAHPHDRDDVGDAVLAARRDRPREQLAQHGHIEHAHVAAPRVHVAARREVGGQLREQALLLAGGAVGAEPRGEAEPLFVCCVVFDGRCFVVVDLRKRSARGSKAGPPTPPSSHLTRPPTQPTTTPLSLHHQTLLSEPARRAPCRTR